MIISQLAVSPALRELFAPGTVTFVSPAQADPDAFKLPTTCLVLS